VARAAVGAINRGGGPKTCRLRHREGLGASVPQAFRGTAWPPGGGGRPADVPFPPLTKQPYAGFGRGGPTAAARGEGTLGRRGGGQPTRFPGKRAFGGGDQWVGSRVRGPSPPPFPRLRHFDDPGPPAHVGGPRFTASMGGKKPVLEARLPAAKPRGGAGAGDQGRVPTFEPPAGALGGPSSGGVGGPGGENPLGIVSKGTFGQKGGHSRPRQPTHRVFPPRAPAKGAGNGEGKKGAEGVATWRRLFARLPPPGPRPQLNGRGRGPRKSSRGKGGLAPAGGRWPTSGVLGVTFFSPPPRPGEISPPRRRACASRRGPEPPGLGPGSELPARREVQVGRWPRGWIGGTAAGGPPAPFFSTLPISPAFPGRSWGGPTYEPGQAARGCTRSERGPFETARLGAGR
jgi:hypothetical protein